MLIILIATVSIAALATTKIYKVVKPDGTVIYTDKPPPGASEYKLLKKPNLIPSIVTNPNSKTKQTQLTPVVKPMLELLTPANEATVRNNAGEVTIEASLVPEMTGQFILYLNGQLHARHSAPKFELEGLNRGSYNIKIEFFDQSGKLLASTQPSTFYLHKASALIQAN
ncbi:DUF4124 domain-containing protein [Planctobacterium marinum]|uniref:DUF4124 domain-containing protein n=1 Tax=Planctobacterium marinum TaxID=1631968 RepID=UPI0030C6E134